MSSINYSWRTEEKHIHKGKYCNFKVILWSSKSHIYKFCICYSKKIQGEWQNTKGEPLMEKHCFQNTWEQLLRFDRIRLKNQIFFIFTKKHRIFKILVSIHPKWGVIIGYRQMNFEKIMCFLNALYIVFILNSLIPVFLETPFIIFSELTNCKMLMLSRDNKTKAMTFSS
jgi:hypothetical protein